MSTILTSTLPPFSPGLPSYVPPRGLLVTGTDTGVGKTFVSSLIISSLRQSGLRVGAYKPVCSGSIPDDQGQPTFSDLSLLRQALGTNTPDHLISPQRFHAPLAPPDAARREGRSVDPRLLRNGLAHWHSSADLLLIEGVGGLLCPVTDSETLADLAADWGIPLVVVVAHRLGAINHALLTLEVLRARRLPLAGFILNLVNGDSGLPSALDNLRQIELHTRLDPLGILDQHATQLRSPTGPESLDWSSLFAPFKNFPSPASSSPRTAN